MTPSEDDRLVPVGDLTAFAGIWSVVAIVVLATAACM
jgi:hypothetical protein